MIRAIAIPLFAIGLAMALFGLFVAAVGADPFAVYASIYRAAFGSMFSWENTLVRAAPLMLIALCTAIPAQMGLLVIGNEGAVMLGGLAAASAGLLLTGFAAPIGMLGMALAGIVAGGLFIAAVGALRHWRGVNETISSLLMAFLAFAVFDHLVQGPLRDPSTFNYPGTYPIDDAFRIGMIPGFEVHWGLVIGIVACVLAWLLIRYSTFGFALRICGNNLRVGQMAGLPIGRLVLISCGLGGGAAGLAGTIEVAAVLDRASSALHVGYGWSGILVSFIARHNPIAIIPAAIALGGIRASGGLLQRSHDLPDATVLVFEGIVFLVVLWSETLYGRGPIFRLRARHGNN
ncbi:MAG: ABC transporter permease [Dongiaceae bacterium]